jgi:hypothetical protein
MCRFSAYWYEAAHGAKSSTTSSLRQVSANDDNKQKKHEKEKSNYAKDKSLAYQIMFDHRPGTEDVISLASCQVPFWHVYHFWMVTVEFTPDAFLRVRRGGQNERINKKRLLSSWSTWYFQVYCYCAYLHRL